MLATGTIVSGYRIERLLGEGGMGAVYRATQLSLNRTVALKVLAPEFSDDETFRERFRREGLLQAAIDHQNIVTVYEAGETEDGLFLAMRLVRGTTLKDEILSDRLTTERTIRILVAVADALDAAHEVGLIHRDVKPQNILVGARDHAYLADFGLTKVPDESVPLTGTGQFVGTIDYISPEQVRGEVADHRSDVYALAGVLYESLTGSVPYPRASEAAVLFAHMSEPPPSLCEARPDLPAELEDLIAHGMAKNRDERVSSAGGLMRGAAAALGTPVTAARPARLEGDAGQSTRPAATAPIEASSDATVARDAVTAPASTVPAAETVRASAATPVPVTPAKASSRPPSRGLVAVLIGVLAAAAAGFLVGTSGSENSGSEPSFSSSASAGEIQLSFPGDWTRLQEAPGVRGMALRQPITLGPQDDEANRLGAGLTAGTGITLLPSGFLRHLPSEPKGEPVKLGEFEAFRYARLRPKGSPPLTVYTVPTSGGVATVTCRGEPEFLERCERVAGTLQLAGVNALPLGPSDAYGRALGQALDPLRADRSSGGERLRDAETPEAQARAAGSLADAYGDAARSLVGAAPGPAERRINTQLVTSLRRLRSAYLRLAGAAEAGDEGAYSAASRAVRAGERLLQRALADLESLGYRVS